MYRKLDKRADAIIQLLDALCASPNARSIVELSLSPLFHRGHDSVYKAIEEFSIEELADFVTQFIPKNEQERYIQLSADVTPAPRESAYTLEDRGFVYQPTNIKGNKPITIGHQYSTVVYHPPEESKQSPHWVVPMSVKRVAVAEDKEMVGAKQLAQIMESTRFAQSNELVVVAGDSGYSKVEYLYDNQSHENLVCISRVSANRTFYIPYEAPLEEISEKPKKPGRKKRYGAKFKLPDKNTWPEPASQTELQVTTKKGRSYIVHLQQWNNVIMKGKNKPKRMAMYKHPFLLIRVCWIDQETGEARYPKDMWIIVMGKRRAELSLEDSYHCYGKRYDIEHFFRFGKQKLLMDAYQTPKVENEENWWELVHLAYVQLWLAREVAKSVPRPWEDHLKTSQEEIITPAVVQREFARIKSEFEAVTPLLKPRGNVSGSQKGQTRTPRTKHPVIKKGDKSVNSS